MGIHYSGLDMGKIQSHEKFCVILNAGIYTEDFCRDLMDHQIIFDVVKHDYSLWVRIPNVVLFSTKTLDQPPFNVYVLIQDHNLGQKDMYIDVEYIHKFMCGVYCE